MKYISLMGWHDLEDGHLYNQGDEFPHDGRKIPAERIKALTTTQNKAGFALIEACPVEDEGKPVKTAEAPKKAVRSRKKTV